MILTLSGIFSSLCNFERFFGSVPIEPFMIATTVTFIFGNSLNSWTNSKYLRQILFSFFQYYSVQQEWIQFPLFRMTASGFPVHSDFNVAYNFTFSALSDAFEFTSHKYFLSSEIQGVCHMPNLDMLLYLFIEFLHQFCLLAISNDQVKSKSPALLSVMLPSR